MSVWGIVTGISTPLGIISLILYLKFKGQETYIQSESISTNLVDSLNKIDPETKEILDRLPEDKRLEYLNNQSQLNKQIVADVIKPYQNWKGKLLLFSSISLISLAIIFGIIWFTTNAKMNNENKQENKNITDSLKLDSIKATIDNQNKIKSKTLNEKTSKIETTNEFNYSGSNLNAIGTEIYSIIAGVKYHAIVDSSGIFNITIKGKLNQEIVLYFKKGNKITSENFRLLNNNSLIIPIF